MIKRLKRKVILLCALSLFLLLAITVVAMNVINYRAVVREADDVLSLLSRNKGSFEGFEQKPEGGEADERPAPLPPSMSPELPYESRYFSVVLNGAGEVIHADTGRIAAVDRDTAVSLATDVWASGKTSGFRDQLRFAVSAEGDTVRVTFLDCGRQLDVFRTFLLASVGIALCGFLLVFLMLFFLSGRIIRPIAESYEKQARFITDAGHELKTPLTVIRANVDLLEADVGQNESLADIRQQSERLADLTNDLVRLSRMEEGTPTAPMIEFPVSEVVEEEAARFTLSARAADKRLVLDVAPMLTMKGDAAAIARLVSILMDNALKYSAEKSEIALTLSRTSRALVLSVANHTPVPVTDGQLCRVFDRFYRIDASRNSATGGHGIGLSVARAITQTHGGRITALRDKEGRFVVRAEFPVQKLSF